MKERVLTVMVPIRDEDAIPVTSLPPVSPVNINVIYKHEGVYKRVRYNGMYEYQEVVDREFPYVGEPLEIADFTYDAVRMGTAPTISANGVMWQADKDENGNYISIAKLWRQECYVLFNGEKFYLSRIPTATKSNDDARYKYDIDFVSERVCLETVYLYDVVQPYVSSRPISESSVFSFYGDITELAKRINASLLRSGLASVALKKNGDVQVTPDSYLTYEEFNAVGLGTYTGSKDTSDPYLIVPEIHYPHANIYEHFGGNYTLYLLNRVYVVKNPKIHHVGPVGEGYDEIVDGEPVITGYQCVIGYDKKGVLTTSEEKLIPFEDNTIHEALQQVHDTYELQYYIYRERDSSWNFTGNTIIMIGDCEHDFADRNNLDTDYVRDEDGLPTTQSPFDYGVDKALISKEKANSTEKIVTRITGKGSTENIPWYYPNPTADGWIKPAYNRLDTVLTDMGLTYPLTEGDDATSSALYEKYIKNKIGNDIVYGHTVDVITNSSYRKDDPYNGWGEDEDMPNAVFGQFRYVIRARSQKGVNVPNPSIDMSFRIPSGVIKYYIKLQDNTANTYVEFDSTETYQNPNEFQQICAAGGTTSNYQLTSGHIYYLIFNVWLNSIPNSETYDVEGYLYPSHKNWYPTISHPDSSKTIHIRQDFYSDETLGFGTVLDVGPHVAPGMVYPNIFYADYSDGLHTIYWGGYCKDNVAVEPIRRIVGQKCLNKSINVITGEPFNTVFKCVDDGKRTLNAYEVAQMDIYEWVDTRFYLSLKLWSADSWYINNKAVTLADYGLSITGSPVVKDTITFSKVKYITPCGNLMPSVYINTDGERRFYNAHNYEPYQQGTPDTAIGEMNPSGSTNIINPLYQKEGSTSHYKFKNENIANRPKEHIENFEDVKPTITGQVNTVGNDTFRIDVVEMFAYDELDDNDVWENNDDGNVQGEYKHPYFFAKIRPLGFNIFDLALQEDMVLSMTTGHCGACNFKIGVDETTKKNPVQIWEYNVYEGENYIDKVLKYHSGELRRYVDTSNLYYDTTPGDADGYIPVDRGSSNLIAAGFLTPVDSGLSRFRDRTYTSDEVINGEVGSLKQNSKKHFEGDVMVKGKFIPSQQDTTTGYVWIALYKDIDTYGTIMPYAKPDYGDCTYSHYIDPKGHYYTDRKTGEEFVLTDTEADKFVFLNIRLPQAYLRTAETYLSRKLIAYMYDNNYEKFNFSINFSRIFLEENPNIESLLNENSALYVRFDDEIYRQYVKHYTYKVTKNSSLPEISVDLNEELTYTNTKISQQQQAAKRRSVIDDDNRLNRLIRQSEARIERRCVSRTGDAVVEGNIIVRDAGTSVVEIQESTLEINNNVDVAKERIVTVNDNLDITKEDLESAKEDITDNKEYLDDFVDAVNTFNDGASQRINQIKQTVEHRLPVASGGYIEHGCDTYKFNHNELTHKTELLWYNSDGTTVTVDDDMCYGDDTNMTSITWDEFDKR